MPASGLMWTRIASSDQAFCDPVTLTRRIDATVAPEKPADLSTFCVAVRLPASEACATKRVL